MVSLGQLVKLQDYISRYEADIFMYPSRFIRLKRKQWERKKFLWENGVFPTEEESPGEIPVREPKNKKWGILGRIRGKRETPLPGESLPRMVLPYTPKTLTKLKQQFLDELYPTQILWASSTLTERSFVDASFYGEGQLKFLLQRLPDTFLLFYRPIFLLKNAPVETESVLVTPTELYVLSFLEEEDESVFIGSENRFWEKRLGDRKKKRLNPLVHLNRTENIVKGILHHHGIHFPIFKLIFCRNGYIDYPAVPFGIELVDKRSVEHWLERMRKLPSPLKHDQLLAAKALLDHCKTTAVDRTEWKPMD